MSTRFALLGALLALSASGCLEPSCSDGPWISEWREPGAFASIKASNAHAQVVDPHWIVPLVDPLPSLSKVRELQENGEVRLQRLGWAPDGYALGQTPERQEAMFFEWGYVDGEFVPALIGYFYPDSDKSRIRSVAQDLISQLTGKLPSETQDLLGQYMESAARYPSVVKLAYHFDERRTFYELPLPDAPGVSDFLTRIAEQGDLEPTPRVTVFASGPWFFELGVTHLKLEGSIDGVPWIMGVQLDDAILIETQQSSRTIHERMRGEIMANQQIADTAPGSFDADCRPR